MNPVAWSLLMLLLLALSSLAGHRLGSMLADRRHKMVRRGHESELLPREEPRHRPPELVMTFVNGSPQIESSSTNLPDEDAIEKMLEDAQAYANSVHGESGKSDESELKRKGIALDEDRKTIGEETDTRTTGQVDAARPWYPGEIPLVGAVAAGAPILAEENIEAHLPVAQELFGTGQNFGLRIQGSSMVDAGILDGDLVVVRPQPTADDGDIILALIDDEATVKRLKRLEDRVLLLSDNPAYSPIDAAHAIILGKVVGIIRHIRNPQ